MNTSQHVLYIGSYATVDQPGIHACTFDNTTGELTLHASFAGVANPSFVVVHPNGHWLYAVSETNQQKDNLSGAVWAFRCRHEPWSIEPINHQMSGGDSPCHLEIDSNGRWLLVSNYHRFVIVADLGIDALLVYEFDPSAGRLHAHTHTITRPGAGPRHLAFHPNGQLVYVANELDNTVAVYDYDAANGRLRERQVVETLPSTASESTVADIHISPLGDRVYVSNRGHDSVAIFAVEMDGRLARVAIRSCGGRWPRNFAIAPGNRFLLVANQHSDEVVVLPVLSGSEALGAPTASVALTGVSCVHFVATTQV